MFGSTAARRVGTFRPERRCYREIRDYYSQSSRIGRTDSKQESGERPAERNSAAGADHRTCRDTPG